VRIVELDDPVVRFIGDNLDGIDPKVLWTAAFEADVYGNPVSNRPPGIHLSHILHFLYEKIEKPKRDESSDGLIAKNTKMSVGIGWEFILSLAIGRVYPAGRIIYPGYYESDGIVMNPDRFDYEEDVLEEFKCTWFSLRKARTPDDFRKFFWWWVMQAQAYCRVLKTLRARFRVLFINGDYAPPKPKPKQWQFDFTQSELDANWRIILATGREMKLLK